MSRSRRSTAPVARRINALAREFGFELFAADPSSLGFGITQTPSLRNTVLRSLARAGYGVRRTFDRDVPTELIETYERVRPYTMTSQRSVVGLCEAVRYIVGAGVEGAFVECGVWRGGSVMAIALTLVRLGACDRELYLFDTFAGMPPPGEQDESLMEAGHHAEERWQRDQADGRSAWAYAPAEEVRVNVLSTGYPADRVHLVAGPVEETIPAHAPGSIALLRLDTDWYGSTRHELEHLYPRLSERGVLIIDDYGSWSGARRAVDEYPPMRELLLARLDASARIAVKPRA